MAQYVAVMGYSNVGLGLVHGMAHALGGFYSTPHGVANGVLLAAVMAFNAEASGENYRQIAATFGVEDALTMPLEDVRQAAVDSVAQFTRDLGNPLTITAVGAREEDIPALAEAAFADLCTGGNPRTPTAEEIEALYRSLV